MDFFPKKFANLQYTLWAPLVEYIKQLLKQSYTQFSIYTYDRCNTWLLHVTQPLKGLESIESFPITE